ncbi:MAG: homocysteine S-methyltransferase family protein [Christensenellales bacterium]|jgi:5-methyltetrahydrofolate--homocysteine methyltransferase
MRAKNKWMDWMQNGRFFLDGGTGTNLQKAGMGAQGCPEAWAAQHPDRLIALQREYLAAGCQAVRCFTFGANPIKLGEYGLADQTEALNETLVRISRQAADGALVGGSIGPLGRFVQPFGELSFEDAVEAFARQVRSLQSAGVDFFSIETMIDIQEARAALLAVKENSDKPVLASMTYSDGRTLTGTDPVTALITLQSLGADAVGVNCSSGPKEMADIIEAMYPYAKVPIAAGPNAGLPRMAAGELCYDMDEAEFAAYYEALPKAGASILGGCCGTTPEYMRRVIGAVRDVNIPKRRPSRGYLSSARQHVAPTVGGKTLLVGERINPTGKKALQEQLLRGDIRLALQMAGEQMAAGADMLDVNVGMPGIDEVDMLAKMVGVLSSRIDLPLCIDSSNPKAIEAALRIYPGRALVNSVSAEEDKLGLLEICKKYGAMFIALPIDDNGLAHTCSQRKALMEKIVEHARCVGLEQEDMVVDALALTISAEPQAGVEAIDTIEWAAGQGIQTIIGLSNISFGLPGRPYINAAFLLLAVQKGLSMMIANPTAEHLMPLFQAGEMLLGKEDGLERYTTSHTQKKETRMDSLFAAVVAGREEEAVAFAEKELEEGRLSLIEEQVAPALEEVGRLFEAKEYFLPQLVKSAETAKKVFDLYLSRFPGDGEEGPKIILATVKGDLHDIGKNIVGLMLKNHGFHVIDLGKDVDAEVIVERAIREKACIVGLSALITTTMVQMPRVVALLKERGWDCPVMVGGAVLNREYADEIGAHYAEDAMRAVELAKRLLAKEC